ncbi:MAG TPA: tRNA (adenosine(37)-N6)-threonylcarbamoyltransferase complex dimerization subunit type 1 TsaB [Phaeodactylibacter sp.]|nr:tRNA (adenosine(37)-N6)-threonylcarbamoyltransferase complex dimerization subunit type 1 TsaB [Phaeodactylibacter sp.]
MPFILHIETATDVCAVALAEGGRLLQLEEAAGSFQHAAQLTLLIQSAFAKANREMSELDAVAVSSGPGSYTSLRIGTATAKGICYALNKPLIAVNTLQSLALACLKQEREEGLYYPMIDARRMEVYTAAFDATNEQLTEARPLIVEAHTFDEQIAKGTPVILCGNGAVKCQKVLPKEGIHYSTVVCSAAHLLPLALQAYEREKFEDVAYYDPFYLKPPNITTPKKIL